MIVGRFNWSVRASSQPTNDNAIQTQRGTTTIDVCLQSILLGKELQQFFQPAVESRTHGHDMKLAKRRTTRLSPKFMLSIRVTNLWNSLPPETVQCSSEEGFKRFWTRNIPSGMTKQCRHIVADLSSKTELTRDVVPLLQTKKKERNCSGVFLCRFCGISNGFHSFHIYYDGH